MSRDQGSAAAGEGSPKTPSKNFVVFSSPDPNGPLKPEQWVAHLLKPTADGGEGLLEKTKGGKVAVFKNFPPAYFDHYDQLQTEIAKRYPNEQDRPYIALQIRGKNRLADMGEAVDVGLAGGTGPLSDAKMFEGLVLHRSKKPKDQLTREEAAVACEDFSGVLFSMPPPRDLKHVGDIPGYRKAYVALRDYFPHQTLHLLSNTAHLHIKFFANATFLGGGKDTLVIDMTKNIARRVSTEPAAEKKVLVLGTKEAADKKLYPSLLKDSPKGVLPTTIKEDTGNQAKLLQDMIDRVKKGELNNPSSTLGEEFVRFVTEHVARSDAEGLLFSCTEIPLLLGAEKEPGVTYLDFLKTTLINTFLDNTFQFFDTEHMFVECIDNAQLAIAANRAALSAFDDKSETVEVSSVGDQPLGDDEFSSAFSREFHAGEDTAATSAASVGPSPSEIVKKFFELYQPTGSGSSGFFQETDPILNIQRNPSFDDDQKYEAIVQYARDKPQSQAANVLAQVRDELESAARAQVQHRSQ